VFGISDEVVTPILIAFIAGAVSLLALVVPKETKTSEFRQAWIDAIRAETAQLIAQMQLYADHRSGRLPGENPHEALLKVRTARAMIRLRMNPWTKADNERRMVEDALDAIDSLIRAGNLHQDAVDQACANLENALRPILKANWQTVKRGEPLFLATVAIAVILLVLAPLGLWAVVQESQASPPNDAPRLSVHVVTNQPAASP
jgi:hypothetical protein